MQYFRLLHAFRQVIRVFQRRSQIGDVIRPARLHGDVDHRVSEHCSVVRAIVRSLYDVCFLLGDDRGEAYQCSGMVGQMNAQADQAAVFYQSALDNSREQSNVDIAAGVDDTQLLSAVRNLFVQSGSGGCGPRAGCARPA